LRIFSGGDAAEARRVRGRPRRGLLSRQPRRAGLAGKVFGVKRSPLRRKTPIRSRAPLRRRGLARVRARTGTRVSVKSGKAKAWMWFSRFIRLRDSKDGMAKCCSCDYTGSVFGKGCLQAGHFVSGRNNSILYDPRNCHAKCSMCNRWKGGAPVPYEMFMRARYGL